jgi:hypothetical protein
LLTRGDLRHEPEVSGGGQRLDLILRSHAMDFAPSRTSILVYLSRPQPNPMAFPWRGRGCGGPAKKP